MANIAITTYCNLHCPYCFANKMITTQDIKNITLEQFEYILNWIVKNKDKEEPIHLGIIGGEPTLHPQFLDILTILNKYHEQYNIKSILFTNGIYLHDYIGELPDEMNLLININTPTAMTAQQWKLLNKNINRLISLGWIKNEQNQIRVTLGCNLCNEIDDYSFFWNIVDRVLPKQVRMSVTAPIKDEFKKNKDLYYTIMKPKFLTFLNEAKKRNIILNKDCNQIPMCMFSPEELEDVNKYTIFPPHQHSVCGPVVDITPDFQASACFGAYELVDCSQFSTLENLEFYLLNEKIMPKFKKNNTGMCSNCIKHTLYECQGGCLAFA